MSIREPKSDPRFLSRYNVECWAEGIVTQADILNSFTARHKALSEKAQLENRNPMPEIQRNMREFQRHRVFFIVATYRLLAFGKWAMECGAISKPVFSELLNYETEIISMRDMTMHDIPYLKGGGRHGNAWTTKNEFGTIDASATYGDSLGGKLSISEMRSIAQDILDNLPPFYWETQETPSA